MHKVVVWSPLADDDLNAVIEYLLSNWSNTIAQEFLNQLDNNIKRIIDTPKQFPLVYKTRKYRKCVITKHNTLFYKEIGERIMILRLFDTRQNPKKLKLK